MARLRERARGSATAKDLLPGAIVELSARVEVGALISAASSSIRPGIGAAAVAFKGAARLSAPAIAPPPTFTPLWRAMVSLATMSPASPAERSA